MTAQKQYESSIYIEKLKKQRLLSNSVTINKHENDISVLS